MSLPSPWAGRLRLPVVAAPMFLVSGPDLVTACCRAGILGSFPALNCRSTAELDAWLVDIEQALGPVDAPFAVNLIVHRTNHRLEADLSVIGQHRVPLVITSLGAVRDVVDTVHAYGGLVFHDVTNLRHAERAAHAGVDGIICVAAGAGGHAGTVSPFALVAEVRQVFDGTVLLAGGLSSGGDVLAARAMGADLAYLGTRFLATAESLASAPYKAMIGEASAEDVVYTAGVSSIPANFLRASLAAAGVDIGADTGTPDLAHLTSPTDSDLRAWRDVWSAGHGVGSIHDVPSVAALVDRMVNEWQMARQAIVGLSPAFGAAIPG